MCVPSAALTPPLLSDLHILDFSRDKRDLYRGEKERERGGEGEGEEDRKRGKDVKKEEWKIARVSERGRKREREEYRIEREINRGKKKKKSEK